MTREQAIDTDEGFSPCECSECKSVEFKKSKFCPNCDAKMKEGEKWVNLAEELIPIMDEEEGEDNV